MPRERGISEMPALAALLRTLGSPTRLAILAALLEEPASVVGLARRLGLNSTGGLRTGHLRWLIEAGLVEARFRGRSTLYTAIPRLAAGVLTIDTKGLRITIQSTEEGPHKQTVGERQRDALQAIAAG